jgi:hypothetical protein
MTPLTARGEDETMYDLAKAIQRDRRREACLQRLAARVTQPRLLALGRYRITVEREPRDAERLAKAA